MGSNFLLILVALLLVLLNGFFVAAEFGLVKLRQTRVRAIAKLYGWRGQVLAKVHESLDAYLSACQLGITLSSLGLGWIGEPAFAEVLEPALTAIGVVNENLLHGIAFFVAFFLISYLHIVIGELAPKSWAIRQSERVGLWTAAPLYGFYWLMYPLIWILNHSANRILHWLGLPRDAGHDSHYSAEELKLILRSSRADNDYTADEWRVLAQALDFRDLEVSDLMRPFSEAVALSAAEDMESNVQRIVKHRYSRYPYLDEEGRVKGVIHLKDIFFSMRQHGEPPSLDELVRPAVIVSPHLSATELFRRFRSGAPHFAVVAFRNGRPLGFITLDNLLGALVGEIRDEFRQSQNQWTELPDGSLLGRASLPIFTLERALGVDIEEQEVNSVGGLILQKLGSVPREGQRVPFEGFEILVRHMEGPRIAQVQVFARPLQEDYGDG